jgi:hypothetical protein
MSQNLPEPVAAYGMDSPMTVLDAPMPWYGRADDRHGCIDTTAWIRPWVSDRTSFTHPWRVAGRPCGSPPTARSKLIQGWDFFPASCSVSGARLEAASARRPSGSPGGARATTSRG